MATASLSHAVARADTTKLYIKQMGASSVAYYYIFYEPAETGTAPSVTSTNHYGIKVSKDGVSVKTANILQQTFNSEKNSLKISATGDTTSTASGSRTVQIAHGLSVTPGYLCFYEVDNNGNWYSSFTSDYESGKEGFIAPYTDATNLNIVISTSSSATVKVHYMILVDSAQ